MANIQEDINQIATARYGREVRGSIVNALTLMNEESSEAIDKAVTAQDSATASAAEAKGYADRLVDLGGGTTGQVLTKNSDEDFDYSWEESQGGTSDAYETTYGESNVGDTLDIMPRLAGAVQGTSPTPKDADTLGGKYRAEDIDLIKKNLVWKQVYDEVGQISKTIDFSKYHEIALLFVTSDGVRFVAELPARFLLTDVLSTYVVCGGYTGSYNAYAHFVASKDTFNGFAIIKNGVDMSSTSRCIIFAR